jgi:hypothetical protein
MFKLAADGIIAALEKQDFGTSCDSWVCAEYKAKRAVGRGQRLLPTGLAAGMMSHSGNA